MSSDVKPAGVGTRLLPVAILAVVVLGILAAWAVMRARGPAGRPLSTEEARRLIHEKNLAIGLLENQSLSEALPALEGLRDSVPGDPLPIRNLAVARVVAATNAGQPAPADLLDVASRALAEMRRCEGPSSAADWLGWHLAANRGDWREAERFCAALVARDPADASGWYERARALAQLAALPPGIALPVGGTRPAGDAGPARREAAAALERAIDLAPRNLWLVVEWLRATADRLADRSGGASSGAPPARDAARTAFLETAPSDTAATAEGIAARWPAIAPFAPAIKAFGRIDVRELLDDAVAAVRGGDTDRAAGRLRTLANVLVAQTDADRRAIDRHPLEFVTDRFRPEFYARHGLAESETPPSIPVSLVAGAAVEPSAAAGSGQARGVLLEDVDLDGDADLLVLHDDRIAAYGRVPVVASHADKGGVSNADDGGASSGDTAGSVWREFVAADVPAGATGFLAVDLDLDFDEARRATAAARPDTDPRGGAAPAAQRGCPAADLDLVVWGAGGIACLENRVDTATNTRTLQPFAESGLTAAGAVRTAAVADLDADGQLDLVTVDDAGLHVWIRHGPGRFAAMAGHAADGDVASDSDADDAAAGSLPPAAWDVSAILAIDWDRDVDVDLVVAGKGGVGWIENLRHGQFRWAAFPEGEAAANAGDAAAPAAAPLTAIDAIDAGADACWDLLLGGSGGLRLLPARRTATGVVRTAAAVPIDAAAATGLATWDYDNDGLLDLAAWDAAGLRVLRGLPEGRFAATDLAAVAPRGIRGFDAADIDRDGDLDAAVVAADGVTILENRGGNAHHWLDIDLEAQQIKGADFAPSGRVNAHGLGGTVELKAGLSYQPRFVRRRTTHFGLGDRAEADVVRVNWLNGVPQNIIRPQADLLLCEQQVLLGSCPYAYAWNGERFEFVTDLLWNAPLGLQRAEGQLMPARAWEYLKIPSGVLVPRDGQYVLQITEELWEAAYFDLVRLVVVDHPAAVEIESNEKVGPAEIAAHTIHTLAAPRPPVAARDHRGRDVLPALARVDEVYLRPDAAKRRQGLLDEHAIELDFGPLADPARVMLFLRGWTFPTTVGLNLALARDPALGTPVPPSLAVPDGAGGWRTVLPFMGFPGGKTKTIAIDLSGLVPAADPRVRIATTMEIAWDAAWITCGEEPAPLQVVEVAPASADLHHRGVSAIEHVVGAGPERFRYEDVSTTPRWPPMLGRFTRHGPVTALVAAEDDLLVVMAAGDEMTLTFPAPPGPPPGWRRDFLIHSVGWDKDANLATAAGQSVEPLPFVSMRSYPPAPDDEPRATPARDRWLRDYQTRVQAEDFWQAIRRHGMTSPARSRTQE
jgi:hypothetical protein